MKKRHIVLGGFSILLLAAGATFFFRIPYYRGKLDDFGEVDLERVMACATRSNSSYHEPDMIREEFGAHVVINDFPQSGLRIFVDSNRSGDWQWLVIRGTANLANTYADLEFVEREDHELGVRVHLGFDEALRECLPWVLEHIDRDRPVLITGHSLGGSVAVLLVAVLHRRGFEDVSAVTFGQPKVTDAGGAEALGHLKVLRVVYDDDPVPLVPPLSVGDGDPDAYFHFGAEVVLKADGHFYYLASHDPGRLDVLEFWAGRTHLRPKTHFLTESYIPSLKLAKKHSTDR